MNAQQPEALRLAAALDELFGYRSINTDIGKVATELRRLHAMNVQLSWVNQCHEMRLSVRGYEIQIDSLETVNKESLKALESDRQLLQQALDALEIAEVDGNCCYEATGLLRTRLAHCDRCGKRLGGEGDIHTCTPDPIGDAQSALIAEMAAQPEQKPVAWPMDADAAKRIAEKQFVSYEMVQLIAREILATPPAAAQPAPATDNTATWSDELALIESVLKGYPDSIAKADALRAVRGLQATPPAAQRWAGKTDDGKILVNPPAAPVQEPTVPDNSQDWAGMSGIDAYMLIERHANGWGDIRKMMGEWLAANTPPAAAQPTNLASVVQAHIKDLRACLPTLLGYAELSQTAAEVKKAADELEAALATPPAAPVKERMEVLDRIKEALPEFRQQDDYLLAHGASLLSEQSHEIIHIDTALRIAGAIPPAAQPEQEPVAWMHTMIDDVVVGHRPADLNRHPERWKPLVYANTIPHAAQPAQQEPYGWVQPNPNFNSGIFNQGAECPSGWVGSAIDVYTTPPAAAQPEQKSVAWVDVKDTHHGPYEFHGKELLPVGKHDLYTTPPVQPTQQGLADEVIKCFKAAEMACQCSYMDHGRRTVNEQAWQRLMQAVAACAHVIKE
jgi:hypothetical protein